MFFNINTIWTKNIGGSGLLDKEQQRNIWQEVKKVVKKQDKEAIEQILYYGEMDIDLAWKSFYLSYNYNELMKWIKKKLRSIDFMQYIYEYRLFQLYFLYKEIGKEQDAQRIREKIKNLQTEIKEKRKEVLSIYTEIKELQKIHGDKIKEYMEAIEADDDTIGIDEEYLERELAKLGMGDTNGTTTEKTI